jgi:hypothetical protein
MLQFVFYVPFQRVPELMLQFVSYVPPYSFQCVGQLPVVPYGYVLQVALGRNLEAQRT